MSLGLSVLPRDMLSTGLSENEPYLLCDTVCFVLLSIIVGGTVVGFVCFIILFIGNIVKINNNS